MSNISVLILKADRLQGEILQQVVSSAIHGAVYHVCNRLEEAEISLRRDTADLLITGIDSLEGDVIDFLTRFHGEQWWPASSFVVTNRREPHIVSTLRSLPINGVFDSLHEGSQELGNALQTVISGKNYWSKTLSGSVDQGHLSTIPLGRMLTPIEQMVLSVIGDGCDDRLAAEELGLQVSTVSTVRRKIHSKLGIRHRGELVRQAIFQGYVCLIAGRVVRPGFSLLSAACQPRRTRKRLRASLLTPVGPPTRVALNFGRVFIEPSITPKLG